MVERAKPTTNETVGNDDIHGVALGKPGPRRNIPILMLLQGETVGKKFLLNKPRMQIGRSPDSDMVLADFEVSRKHSVIIYENIERPDEPPRCYIHDLTSKNGTFVNGKRVVSHVLHDKDIITIGAAVFGYYLKDEIEIKFDAQLYSLATVDSLTGVYNKFYFQRTFQREFQRSARSKSPLSLFFIDIDHFKKTNDTFGHLAGDFVLRKIGEILLRNMREYDICGRYGGEEFTVALPATPLDAATMVADRLRAVIEGFEFKHQEQTIPTTVSIGVACSQPSVSTPEELLQIGDEALYRAKQEGRNRVIVARGQ
jgi:two-component system, cell cycle response regulator